MSNGHSDKHSCGREAIVMPSNARELWTVMQQQIFYNRGPHFSHVL